MIEIKHAAVCNQMTPNNNNKVWLPHDELSLFE